MHKANLQHPHRANSGLAQARDKHRRKKKKNEPRETLKKIPTDTQ